MSAVTSTFAADMPAAAVIIRDTLFIDARRHIFLDREPLRHAADISPRPPPQARRRLLR
jgi:hypothetical protein